MISPADHVLAYALHHQLVALASHVRDPLRAHARHLRHLLDRQRQGPAQTRHDPVDRLRRLAVRGLDVPVEAAVRDGADRVPNVVEHDHRVAQQEHRLGNADRVVLVRRHAWLEVADRFVAHVAHRPARQARQPRQLNRLQSRERLLQRLHRVALVRLPRPRADDLVRVRPDERVARQPLPALHRLQQERVLPLAHLQVRRDGRLQVRRHLPVDRNQVSPARRRERLYLVERWVQHGQRPPGGPVR